MKIELKTGRHSSSDSYSLGLLLYAVMYSWKILLIILLCLDGPLYLLAFEGQSLH
jgi:hypothetical protein